LDRLVGIPSAHCYGKKVRSRFQAGRVQSVALRLVVERERENRGFKPVEYWSISAALTPKTKSQAYLTQIG